MDQPVQEEGEGHNSPVVVDSVPPAAVSRAIGQERKDAMAKQGARGTSRIVSRPGAVSVDAQGPPGEMAALRGGPIVMTGVESSQMEVAVPPAAVSRATAQERKDAMTKQRARGTSKISSRPVTALASTSPSPPAGTSRMEMDGRVSPIEPTSNGHVATSGVTEVSAAVLQERQEAMAKQRARGTSRMSTLPGAVSVAADGPSDAEEVTVQPGTSDLAAKNRSRGSARGTIAVRPGVKTVVNTSSSANQVVQQVESDAMAKARARSSRRTNPPIDLQSSRLSAPTRQAGGASATQADKDAQAKASVGKDESAMVEIGPIDAPSAEGLDEIARKRESRAQARATRRGRNLSSHESRSGSTTVFSNMSEDERQRQYDAKMAEIGIDTASKATMAPSIVRSSRQESVYPNMSELERHQSSNSKMSDHYESQEKRMEKSSDLSHLRSEQPVKTPALPAPVMVTTADLGMAETPEVEYGKYTPASFVKDNDLAVAIAIDVEEEEEKHYALAVEYDPDSKPPLYQNRRFRLYGMGASGCFCVVLIVIIIFILGSDKGETVLLTLPPTEAPTMSPTSARESVFLSIFREAVGEKILMEGTPHNRAAQWIMNEDPRQLEPDDPDLLQRFILAFFYFHTTNNGQNKWRSCNRPDPEAGEDDTCEYLEFTRLRDDSVEYVPRKNRIRWLSGEKECRWQGVQCAGGEAVLGFQLFGQQLTGTLPTELIALPFLQRISIAYNEMVGTLPAEYANLPYLLEIEVHGNMLTGTIPIGFFEGESLTLQNFNIGDNMIEGTLDSRIGLFTDLKGLHLFENNLEGTFPTEVGNLSSLSFCRINGNEFSGPLPTELGRLHQLSELWYHENAFTGTLPSTLGSLFRLLDFRLWGNSLTGPIPDELFNLSKLKRFSVREMSLTGTLSPKVSQLTDLQQLKVSGNELEGPIPESIQSMTSLKLAWLHWNKFTGAVPLPICALNRPNGLKNFQTDCGGTDPRNECPIGCCSSCCDADRVCLTNSG